MKHFHIGIRVSEIVRIYPREDNEGKGYFTGYEIKGGSTIISTGTWLENIAAVERMLEEIPVDTAYDQKQVKEWLASGERYCNRRVRSHIRRLAEVQP